MSEEEIEKLKDLKAVYSGAIQAGEISIANIIEGGINLIEKLQKENEELRLEEKRRIIGRYGDTEIHKVINKVLVDDYISKQKVKDKIEELEKGPLKINENNKYYYETDAYNKIIIQVLQELLESED